MGVGSGSVEGYGSYLAVGRESTHGTQVTSTSNLEFISASLRTVKETKVIEQVETSRTYSKQIKMGKVVEGEVECYAYAEPNAFNYLLQNALGGTITSATATGETTGGLAFTHTYVIGAMDGSYQGLSLNHRKGQGTIGKVWEYIGARVGECNFTAEIDEALKCTFALMALDSTQTTNDVSSVLTTATCDEPLSFVNGRVSVVAGTLGAITTTAYWEVQSVEFGWSNNLKSDTTSRRIGSDTLDVLPVGMATFTLNMNLRFDTTTAYDAMIANTDYAVELEFTGSTLTGSNQKRGLKFQFPLVKISDGGDPEIGGPDEQLTSAVTMQVFRDCSSTGGYAMRAQVTNLTSSY